MHAESCPHPSSLEECRTCREVAGWAVSAAARAVGADVVSCDEIDLRERWIFGINNARSPGAEELFPVLLDLVGEHPVLGRFATGATQSALRVSDVTNSSQFERTELYRRFYGVFGIRHQLIAPIEASPHRFVALALFRQQKPFSRSELRLLNTLVPELQAAWKTVRRVGQAQHDAFHQLGYHLVPVHPGFGGPPVGTELRRLLAHHWGPAAWEQQLESWKQTLLASSQSSDAGRTHWKAPGGLELRVVRLPDDLPALAIRPDSARDNRRSSAWSLLSPREQAVAEWLVEGKTSSVVARLLGVKEPTIRKHLEHMYSKLGVENRASAIRLLID